MRNRKYGVEQWKERKCFLFLFCCFTISLFSWNRKKKNMWFFESNQSLENDMVID